MSPRVLIVGAGIGGLVLAIALRRAHLDVEVLERSQELHEIGAAVGLSANGTRVLDRLGVAERVAPWATEATALIHRDGRSGAVVSTLDAGTYRSRFGRSWWGVHRRDLQRALVDTLASVEGPPIELGRQVVAVREGSLGAEVVLDDGAVRLADVVVGADGVHSVVRDHVAGPGSGPVYSGTSGFRGIVARSALPGLPDAAALQAWIGPGAHVISYALGANDELINFLAVLVGPTTWSDAARDAAPGTLREAFSRWHPAVREMLAVLPQGPRWPLLSQPSLPRWARGRAVLLGDACHAMLPHQGQGANQAIEDAACLAALLTTTDPDAALSRYPRLRRARTRAVAGASWQTGTLYHLPDGGEARSRDTCLGHLEDSIAWIHGHDDGHPHPLITDNGPVGANDRAHSADF